ncbi:hypothetical protein HanHA300_Chr16g0611071 [Helianthus annuus]|nr:hypothetical protein HanHA300_Chr16g0611071 [Helianthus annuus]KAJ0442867.1 hypothetical protein HanIR_Chr16g0814251 [Helianthus annuus]
MLASKRSRLQKETPPAPSESEIDMIVFCAKRGNLLEKIYVACAPQGKDFALVNVETEQVGEGGGDGADGAGGDGRDKGIETEAESSEATPRRTIYTRRPPGGGGATSGVPRSPEFENIQAGSWDTHNPACDDLPHAPRLNLT